MQRIGTRTALAIVLLASWETSDLPPILLQILQSKTCQAAWYHLWKNDTDVYITIGHVFVLDTPSKSPMESHCSSVLCFEYTPKYLVNVLPRTMMFRNPSWCFYILTYIMWICFSRSRGHKTHLCLCGISANHLAPESSISNYGNIQCRA